MHYQIKYDCTGDSRHITATRKWSMRIAVSLVVLLLCSVVLWTFGGDRAVTIDALESMAQTVREGTDIKEAFSSFCLDILYGAELG